MTQNKSNIRKFIFGLSIGILVLGLYIKFWPQSPEIRQEQAVDQPNLKAPRVVLLGSDSTQSQDQYNTHHKNSGKSKGRSSSLRLD